MNFALPEAFDYNFDKFKIFFNETSLDPWKRVIKYDNKYNLTVDPNKLKPKKLKYLLNNTIQLDLAIVDEKRTMSDPYIQEIIF